MESKIKHQYDSALALRAPGGAALTADATMTKIDLMRLTAGRGDLVNRYGMADFDVVVFISAAPVTTNETYVLEFTTYDANGANGQIQETFTVAAGAVGVPLVFKFNVDTFTALDADAAQFSINVNVSGTAPSITLWAFVSSGC
jgi:hypothetical protein